MKAWVKYRFAAFIFSLCRLFPIQRADREVCDPLFRSSPTALVIEKHFTYYYVLFNKPRQAWKETVTSMSSIYFIGIGGTAMASVAVALSQSGHTVDGSDTALYPPMSTYLDLHGIRYRTEFSEENIRSASPDVVVVGNAVSRGNCELEYALECRLELVSMPGIVRKELISHNTSLVVTGTHGKTTTTSLLAWLLDCGGFMPGFLVGGIPENFSMGCRPSGSTRQGFFVTEGDEYDTAFFDKRSKFMLYRPDIAIINNVEFDHADIFDSIEDIRKSFRGFVNLIPRNGMLLVNGDDPEACMVSEKALCPVERFGFSRECQWRADDISIVSDATTFTLHYRGERKSAFTRRLQVALFGNHNIMNTLAATAAACHAGLGIESAAKALPLFKRPKRRMEITEREQSGITLVEDFAHHPTAIRATLEAVASLWKGRRIVACFEPRSNTTTRNIFQNELARCFDEASVVVLGAVHRPERYHKEQLLDTGLLRKELQKRGKKVFLAESGTGGYPEDILGFLGETLAKGDVVVLMSNGSFSNLKPLFLDKFS